MKASAFIPIMLAVLLIFSTFVMQPEKAAADQKHSEGFLGYASSKVVVFISNSTVSDMNKQVFGRGLTGNREIDALNTRYSAVQVKQLFPGSMPKQLRVGTVDLSRWYRIQFGKDVDVEKVVTEYQELKAIEIAEPVSICETYHGTPNDPGYSSQWHLQKIQAPDAWDIETGDTAVVVAILDTGIDYRHRDLGGLGASSLSTTNGNMWINWNERNGTPGEDDDDPACGGYIDDIVGWDFVHDPSEELCCPMIWPPLDIDCLDPDNDPLDDHMGHGTRCSSVISAITNNGKDLSGVAGGWGDGTHQATANGVKVMALRIGTLCGTDMDFMAEAFYYAANNGVRIASVSVTSEYQQYLEEALEYFLLDSLVTRLIFVAAMNTNQAPTDYLPTLTGPMSNYIVTVAATKEDDWKWSQSSYGDVVDVSAPGANILMLDLNNSTHTASGTSYATPMTAAVAALVWSKYPEWEALQVRDRIFDTAEDIPDPLFEQGKLGAGRINAYWAVQDPPVAEFSATPTIGFAPLTVQFTDESTGDPQSWSWHFGDTDSSDVQNPQHEYQNAGTYTVELTVTTPVDSDTEIKTDYITVCNTIAAVQLYAPVNGKTFEQPPVTVNFRWYSTPNADEYNFQLDTSANFSPPLLVDAITEDLVYTQPDLWEGTYYWRVRGKNACGFGDWSATRYIVVEKGVQPSCPVLYSFNGVDYIEENTILQACEKSGYTKVVTDYYQLSSVAADGKSEIRFQLRELEDEITYLHEIELLTVDHSLNSKVACDVLGEITVYEQVVEPISAVDHHGVDQLQFVVDEDGDLFESEESGYLIVTFPKVGPDGSGMILSGGGKLPCWMSPDDGEKEPFIAQLTVEALGADGSWSKLADVPNREYPALERVLHNANPTGDRVTVKLRWSESYRTDVIALYVPKEEVPGVRKWGIHSSRIMQAEPDGRQALDFAPGNPLVLRKGDVFEFSFKPEPLESEVKTRDYIIRAVGLYQPDYAVYSDLAPDAYRLFSNYPNPFNPATTISYDLPVSTWVRLEIFDVSGKIVAVVVDQEQAEGHHTAVWKGTNTQGRAVESGIYFYRLTTREFVESRKMLLMR